MCIEEIEKERIEGSHLLLVTEGRSKKENKKKEEEVNQSEGEAVEKDCEEPDKGEGVNKELERNAEMVAKPAIKHVYRRDRERKNRGVSAPTCDRREKQEGGEGEKKENKKKEEEVKVLSSRISKEKAVSFHRMMKELQTLGQGSSKDPMMLEQSIGNSGGVADRIVKRRRKSVAERNEKRKEEVEKKKRLAKEKKREPAKVEEKRKTKKYEIVIMSNTEDDGVKLPEELFSPQGQEGREKNIVMEQRAERVSSSRNRVEDTESEEEGEVLVENTPRTDLKGKRKVSPITMEKMINIGVKGGVVANAKAVRGNMRKCISDALKNARKDGFMLDEEDQEENWLSEGRFGWAKEMEKEASHDSWDSMEEDADFLE